MRCVQTRATRGAAEDVRSVATSRSDTPGAPWFTHVLRGVAVAIAIAAAIDPAITSTRRTRPLIAVVAADAMVDQVSQALTDAGIEHGRATRSGLSAAITVVPVSVVKGLELDGVVVVEPAAIVAAEQQGLRALDVALTGSSRRFSIVHAAPLPDAMR